MIRAYLPYRMVLPDLLGLSCRNRQQFRSHRTRAMPVLTGHRGDSDQRRAFGPSWRQHPSVSAPSVHRALGTPVERRRLDAPSPHRCADAIRTHSTTYHDIAPSVTAGHRGGRHDVPPHAATATTRVLHPHDPYPRLGRSRHRTSGPRQRSIPAAAAPRASRDRDMLALLRDGIRSTPPAAFALVPTLTLPEEADCSSCTDRGVTGRHHWRRSVREPGSESQPNMASAATAGAQVTGSCFTLSSDAQGQGWPPTSPAHIGTSAPRGIVTQAPWRCSDGAPKYRGDVPRRHRGVTVRTCPPRLSTDCVDKAVEYAVTADR